MSSICLGIIAIFLPPVAVVMRAGCGSSFLINIVLTILGWIPGVIHAWYVIATSGSSSSSGSRPSSRPSGGRYGGSGGRYGHGGGMRHSGGRPPRQQMGYSGGGGRPRY